MKTSRRSSMRFFVTGGATLLAALLAAASSPAWAQGAAPGPTAAPQPTPAAETATAPASPAPTTTAGAPAAPASAETTAAPATPETAATPSPTDSATATPAPTADATPAPAPAPAPAATPETLTATSAAPAPAADGAASTTTAEVAPTPDTPGAPIERGVWYLGLGVGVGAATLAEKGIGGTPLGGTAGIRIGAIIDSFVLVGLQVGLLGQFNAWKEREVVGGMLSSVMAEGMIFPMRELPLNAAIGVGWASGAKLSRLANTGGGDAKAIASSGNGVSWMAGVGWDFFPGKGGNFSVQGRYDGTATDLGVDHMGSLQLWLNFY